MKAKPEPTNEDTAKFMSQVVKTESCWNWTGSTTRGGYGIFRYQRTHVMAHWFLLADHPATGFCACHHCDNPPCVNPDHIFIGTHKDNAQDMIAKGRKNIEAARRGAYTMHKVAVMRRGEGTYGSKLKEHQVALIKATPRTASERIRLSNKYGVCTNQIGRIWRNRDWKHVTADPDVLHRMSELEAGS